MVFVGVVLMVPLLATTVVIVKSRRRLRTWEHTEATVTRVQKRRNTSGNQDSYDIVVRYRFTDRDGQVRSGSETRILRKPATGSTLAVVYDPDAPDHNETAAIGWLYGLAAAAAVAFAIGVWLVIASVTGDL